MLTAAAPTESRRPTPGEMLPVTTDRRNPAASSPPASNSPTLAIPSPAEEPSHADSGLRASVDKVTSPRIPLDKKAASSIHKSSVNSPRNEGSRSGNADTQPSPHDSSGVDLAAPATARIQDADAVNTADEPAAAKAVEREAAEKSTSSTNAIQGHSRFKHTTSREESPQESLHLNKNKTSPETLSDPSRSVRAKKAAAADGAGEINAEIPLDTSSGVNEERGAEREAELQSPSAAVDVRESLKLSIVESEESEQTSSTIREESNNSQKRVGKRERPPDSPVDAKDDGRDTCQEKRSEAKKSELAVSFAKHEDILEDPPLGEGWDEYGVDRSKIANKAVRTQHCEQWIAHLRQEAAAIRAGNHPELNRRSVLTQRDSKRRLDMSERNAKRQKMHADRLYKIKLNNIQASFEAAVEQTRERLMAEVNEEIRRSKSRLEGVKEVENRMNTRHMRGNTKPASIEDPWPDRASASKTNGHSKRPLCPVTLVLDDDELLEDIEYIRCGGVGGASGGHHGANGGYNSYSDTSYPQSGRSRRPPAWRRDD